MTLVGLSGEKLGFQAVPKRLIVLLCAEVVRQGVPDHGPCTANARRPTVDSRCRGTTISCCVADLKRCLPTTSVTGVPPPNPSPAGSWELPKSEHKKLEVGWKGGGYRIILAKQIMPRHAFQSKKYISKLNKIQISCLSW